MPAPSNMLGSVCRGNSEASVYQSIPNGNGQSGGVGNGNSALHRTVSDPTAGASNLPVVQLYDEIFISKPVSETKTMLWEIKDFENIFSRKIERGMNFEFEVGRLGSMERHLPRRSRWRITLERHPSEFLALRVLQISPENKILFYQLNACIMEGSERLPEIETDFKIHMDYPYEGSSEARAEEGNNLFPIRCASLYGDEYISRIQRHLLNGSLFVKVKMEILEDASSAH